MAVELAPELLEILACPNCHGALAVDHERDELVCLAPDCGLAYPVRQGIPVLLIDEARRPDAGLMSIFDDSWLDDQQALAAADPILRRLAEAGARVRRETADAGEPITQLRDLPRPRAVIAAGSEARFIRAMLEPVCPVPFVAWPTHGLPGWVGALDLVVVMASETAPAGLVATVHEAVRRGAQLLIACPARPTIAEHAGSRSTVLLPTATADALAAAIVVLVRAAGAPARSGGEPAGGGRRDGPGRRGVLAVRRRLGQPGQGSGHGPGRRPAAGLGRFGAGGPGQPARRRGVAGGQRAGRPGRGCRRAADHPGLGGAARPVRRPVHRRPVRRPPARPGDAGRRQRRGADPVRPRPAPRGRRAQRRTRLPDRAPHRLRRRALRQPVADRDVRRGLPLSVGLGRVSAA